VIGGYEHHPLRPARQAARRGHFFAAVPESVLAKSDTDTSIVTWDKQTKGNWPFAGVWVSTALKLEDGAQAEDFRVLECLTGKASKRVRRAAAGMHDVLKVRLQGPARADLILVDSRQKRFETPRRPGRTESLPEIAVQCACARRHVGIGGSDPEFVFRPLVTQSDEFKSRICVKINEIAIRRAIGGPSEETDPAIVVVSHSIKFLFENRVHAKIAEQRGGRAARGRIGEGQSGSAKALVVEIAEMTPAAKLELSVQARIAFLCIPEKLRFAEQERWITDAKIYSITIAKLRILSAGSRGIAVKDGAHQGEIIGDVRAQPCAHRREWRRGTGTRHVEGKAYRPAQRRIDESVSAASWPARSASFVPHFCSNQISYSRVEGRASMPLTTM
jgi:hypothetical protein